MGAAMLPFVGSLLFSAKHLFKIYTYKYVRFSFGLNGNGKIKITISKKI
jgi:hypothetical protein